MGSASVSRTIASVALLVIAILLGCAAPAGADPNWVLVNGQDQLADRFGSSDTVFATGSAFGGVGIIPAVDLYVVANADWASKDGDALHDVSNPYHVPNTAVGFEVVDLPIWLPHLRVGAYDVVIDYNEDGVYESAVDDVIGTGPQPGMTVYFDGNRRAIDKQALKNQYAAPWSTVAQAAKLASSLVNAFQVVDSASGAAAFVEGGFTLFTDPPLVDGLPCVHTTCGDISRVAFTAGDQIRGASALWNDGPPGVPSGADLCARVIGGSRPDLLCTIPSDPTAAFSSAEFGSKQLELAAANLQKTVDAIHADPPDPDYRHVPAYASPATQFAPASTAEPAPHQATLANDLDAAAGRSAVLLHALERFDGAANAGNDAWGGRQAHAIAVQAFALADLLQTAGQDAATTAAALRSSGYTGSLASIRDDLATIQQRLSSTGLDSAERASLQAAGWTDAEIANLVALYLERPAADLPADMAAALDAVGPAVAPAVAALWDIASNAENIAQTAPPSEAPVASFTASVPNPATPKRFHFDASGSSDPDGTVTTYAWDFGDGATSTDPAPDHTYQYTGYHYVTLTVGDDTGVTGSTAYYIYAYPGPPTASFTAVPTTGQPPLTVAFDGTNSTDSDGTITSYRWDFGDGWTEYGATVSHTYAFAGDYTFTLTVVDDDGAPSSRNGTIHADGAHAPTASFTLTPDHGVAPLDVTADASASQDPDGPIATYEWTFGDGNIATGVTAQHTFVPGTWTVKLTVTDGDGAKATASKTLTVTYPNRTPNPQPDAIDAVASGSADVLANDSDPDGDALEIVSNTTPDHGTAHCSALGACDYVADDGYAGHDEFTYLVRDPDGLQASAKVNVAASAPTVGEESFALQDDEVTTTFETAVTVDVLANDLGRAPLSVTSTGTPLHGSVTCGADGHCTYVPGAGFSGTDGFEYTARDANNTSATAAVHVTVAAAGLGFHIGADASPGGGIDEGDRASWTVAATTLPAPSTEDELGALPRPAITAQLGGAQQLDPASIRTAKAWAVDPLPRHRAVRAANPAIHARAQTGAMLGEAVSQAFPRPLPPISQGTGGDGHVPILVGTKVFAFFHHSHPTSVTCVDRRTGQRCPGYPHPLPVGSTNIIGPAAIVGARIYVHGLLAPGYTESASLGLFCWDTSKNRSCGMVVVARFRRSSDPTGSAPVLVGGRMYLAGDDGRLYCVDPASDSPCEVASIPTGLEPNRGFEYDIIAHGTRVFVGQNGVGRVACLDVAAGATCTGWPANGRSLGGRWNVVNEHDASGEIIGICAVSSGSGDCVRDDDPATVTSLPGWPGTDDYYQVTAEAETGTRTLMASLYRGGLGCWDWTTLAPCTGGSYDSSGWLNGPPSAYGAAWDGSCVVGLGDPGQVFTIDPAGSTPCTSLQTGTSRRSLDLRDQRCDGTAGGASWSSVVLDDVVPGELGSATVTVRDAATDQVLMTHDLVLGPLDLSGIDPAQHPALTINANAISTAGNPAWNDGVPPRIRVVWDADPQQLCFASVAETHCEAEPAPLTLSSRLDGTAETAETTLDVSRAPGTCVTPPPPPPPPIVPPPPPPPVVPPPPPPPPEPPPPPPPPPPQPPPPAGNELILACAGRRVVLEEVVVLHGRVSLVGVTSRIYVGRRVTLRFMATGKVVGHAVVAQDGTFKAGAPLPPRSVRNTNRARYQASIDAEQSLSLKLVRRMQLTAVQTGGGRITMSGRVLAPLAPRRSDRKITLQRQITCSETETVTQLSPRKDGSFSVTIAAPAGQNAAVYRLHTRVPPHEHSKKLEDTYTLPRAVDY